MRESKYDEWVDFAFQILIFVIFASIFLKSSSMSRMSGSTPMLICGIGAILTAVLMASTFLRKYRGLNAVKEELQAVGPSERVSPEKVGVA